MQTNHEDLAQRCLSGDIRAIARLISLLEDGDRQAYQVFGTLKNSLGRAQIIGITGPPGSGKSTLTDKMIAGLRKRGKRVGVIAVDPSSPFSGGAILGDRLRMQGHATDPGVFIRSLASRGTLGGLSKATASAVHILDAAGYDCIIIETVGVGQSEVDIVKVADTVILVSVPGLGDDIQVIKAGIMEIGDIFVVNKADRDGADRVVREIRAMLETQAMLKFGKAVPAGPDTLAARNAEAVHHGRLMETPQKTEAEQDPHAALELPPVLKTVAETGEGVDLLLETALKQFETARLSGELEKRRMRAIRAQLQDLVSWQVMEYFLSHEGVQHLDRLSKAVFSHSTDIYSAAETLFEEFFHGGIK